jgi:hypothetical protein
LKRSHMMPRPPRATSASDAGSGRTPSTGPGCAQAGAAHIRINPRMQTTGGLPLLRCSSILLPSWRCLLMTAAADQAPAGNGLSAREFAAPRGLPRLCLPLQPPSLHPAPPTTPCQLPERNSVAATRRPTFPAGGGFRVSSPPSQTPGT